MQKYFCSIFQVSDRKDPNWWQASHVENPDVVGLIPSPELEERRKAYVPPEADFVHKISICGARVRQYIPLLMHWLLFVFVHTLKFYCFIISSMVRFELVRAINSDE